jgi:hypothetical protein
MSDGVDRERLRMNGLQASPRHILTPGDHEPVCGTTLPDSHDRLLERIEFDELRSLDAYLDEEQDSHLFSNLVSMCGNCRRWLLARLDDERVEKEAEKIPEMRDDKPLATDGGFPEWLPEEYDPEAPIRERVEVMGGIDGGVEIHAATENAYEVLHQPLHVEVNGHDTLILKTGARAEQGWKYEVYVDENGATTVYSVTCANADEEYYAESKSRFLFGDVDVRLFCVDTDRLPNGPADEVLAADGGDA